MIRSNLFHGTKFNAVIKRNEPLAPLTTLGVGGSADYYVELNNIVDVIEIINYSRLNEIQVFILGGGSNIVVADSGWQGLVLRYVNRDFIFHDTKVEASAGLNWDDLVVAAIDRGLGGIECLSGVPGLVGAAPVQNIGCYGQEVSETIEMVEAVNVGDGKVCQFFKSECGLSYRQSRFKKDKQYLITKVFFNLQHSDFGTVRYDEVARTLKEQNILRPTLADVRRAVLSIRRRKSMIIDPLDPNSKSVGSFFVNPIVNNKSADEVDSMARRSGAKVMPRWPTDDERVKLSAAWLIESAGFQRGETYGRVGLSQNHILAIVNRGGATSNEIIALASKIRNRVRDIFGLTLEPEPVFIGFDRNVSELLNDQSD